MIWHGWKLLWCCQCSDRKPGAMSWQGLCERPLNGSLTPHRPSCHSDSPSHSLAIRTDWRLYFYGTARMGNHYPYLGSQFWAVRQGLHLVLLQSSSTVAAVEWRRSESAQGGWIHILKRIVTNHRNLYLSPTCLPCFFFFLFSSLLQR